MLIDSEIRLLGWLQMWQLQQENWSLREMLRASRSSFDEVDPSRRDLTPHSEAEEHLMPCKMHGPALQGDCKDAAVPDLQEDLDLVGSSQTCSTAASAR